MRKLAVWLCGIAVLVGCSKNHGVPSVITLATTTSTRDTGLLDHLVPEFEKQSGVQVKVVAVGSGQALELGRRGDADVLLTHSPEAELEFMEQGHGKERRAVMYNDFVLLGPADDPAAIRDQDPAAALQALETAKAKFVSRADESGTHKKELKLWKDAKIEPSGDWYIRAGSGMAETLRMADQKDAYTLSDRGTYLSQQKNLRLVVLVEKNPPLDNHYTVITVDPDKHPNVNAAGAQAFADFLIAPETQKMIGAFGSELFGQPLFYPEANASPQ
jgi:tungstate transport system substrate-binding protein